MESIGGQSKFAMNPTVTSLLNAIQRVARSGPQALSQLGNEFKANGRNISPENVTAALREAHQVLEHLKNDTASEESVRELGVVFEAPDSATAISKMHFADPPVEEGESAISHLLMRLQAFQNGDLETAYGRERSTDSGSDPSSAMKANRRPFDPDDSAEAGLQLPTSESLAVKIFTLIAMVTLAAYVGVRMWDVVENIHKLERDGSRTFYRVLVVLVELAYGLSACSSIVSRTRRQRLEAMARGRRDLPFVADDIIAILVATDEASDTIAESIRSHYSAARPDLPFRVVIVADAPGGAAEEAYNTVKREHSSLLYFVKEELARQEYVMNIQDEELQAALNVVLEENMYLGQVLFYSLDRLFLQYGHAISNAAIVCMPASSVVDSENYYNFALSQLQQPGFACVSTPTQARNQPAFTDFLDNGGFAREQVYLSAVGADHKYVVNSTAFMSRGYSLWRVLRRMEMENVDTAHLGWISYAMHIEARQATLSAMTANAPITSVLAPTHPPTVLSQVLDRQAEGFDLALIFDRERPFLSWNLNNPLKSPHDAARVAVFFEFALVIIILITVFANISPWSTDSRIVAGAFLVHYIGMMIFHLATPYKAIAPGMMAGVMRNRVLAPAHSWLYFLNLSRFGVDRRGHFRAVGETTTADLVNYKQKQREAREEHQKKEKLKAVEAKDRAATEAAEKKNRVQQEQLMKKREIAKKKAEAADSKAAAKAAAKAAKEKEKLRRQRRGPGMAMMESTGTNSEIEVELPMAPSEPGPVAEGFFSKKKDTPSEPSDIVSSDVTSNGVKQGKGAPKVKRGKGKDLPKTKPEQIVIPKFTAPKASARSRTGKGERHRPHKFIKGASLPVAAALILLSLLGIFFAFRKVFGSDAPENYTALEVITARSWTISAALLGVYILIAAVIYVSYLGRFSMILTNSVVATLLLLISALIVAAIGALPFLSSTILKTRNAAFDFEELHQYHMNFLSGMAAGERYSQLPPWREASDQWLRQGEVDALAGGWYTGPGLSKFTYPQALMLVDLSFASIAHYQELLKMPSAVAAADRSAATDVRDALIHGAKYLLACHNLAEESIVSHIVSMSPLSADPGAEWMAPEQQRTTAVRVVNRSKVGTETIASVTAAFAAMSVALTLFDENDIVDELRIRANATFSLMETTAPASYESVLEWQGDNVGAFWPSAAGQNGSELYDDMLLAAGLMLYSDGVNPRYKNAVNKYYTLAQQARAARVREGDTGLGGLEDFRLGVDDHWWTANVLLFHADALNSRYRLNLERFISAWKGEYEYRQDIDRNLIKNMDGLMYATPPAWVEQRDTAFATPGPLPMTIRAMSYIMVHAATQLEESDDDREASCFAQGQLRHIMGLNEGQFSYITGVSPDGARYPRQPTVRPPAGPTSFTAPGNNPLVFTGALVNGPDPSGGYQDTRQRPQFNGVGVLNNAPLSLLLASLQSRDLGIEDCIGFKPRDKLRSTSDVYNSGNQQFLG